MILGGELRLFIKRILYLRFCIADDLQVAVIAAVVVSAAGGNTAAYCSVDFTPKGFSVTVFYLIINDV